MAVTRNYTKAQLDELFKAELALTKDKRRQVQADTRRTELIAEEIEAEQEKRLASDDEARVFPFYGGVSAQSAKICMEALGEWARIDANKDRPFTIQICSPGGSVIDGLALIDYIRDLRSQGYTINTHGVGWVASMGGVLLQVGETRTLGKYSHLLIHEVSAGHIGKLSEMEDEMEFTKTLQDQLLGILQERSTLTKKQIARRWKRKDWWLTAEQARVLGFCDEIL